MSSGFHKASTIGLVLVLGLLLGALFIGSHDSKSTDPAPPPPSAAPSAAQKEPAVPHAPMTQAELPTTDGELAVNNLEGSLRTAELRLQRSPRDASALVSFIT